MDISEYERKIEKLSLPRIAFINFISVYTFLTNHITGTLLEVLNVKLATTRTSHEPKQ